tara:strand:+ start:1502 stop:2803 length:1302 start_codon:yes stop_codon:yes gene_type:complete
MNQLQKIFTRCLLTLFILITTLFSQNVELITQKINVENAIRDKVNVTINKLLEQSQYVIIVNARMDLKAFSMSDENDPSSNGSKYSAIPGLLPTVPQNIKQNTGNTYQYSADKYLLYGLDIAIYLESSIASGAMRQNIQALVKESIPEIQDCEDCIRFETMNMSSSGASSSYDNLLAKIEKLEEDKRNAEQQILNWKFDELEKQLAISEDARTEWENQARQREKSRQLADSVRMSNLESIEKEYRKKQDSLYLVTSIKLDEAVRGRLESNDQLTNKLMDIIKSGIDPNADPDLSFPPQQGMSTTTLILVIAGILFAVGLVVVIVLMMSRKPVYLKPKSNQSNSTDNNESSATKVVTPVVNSPAPTSFDLDSATHANDNSDVVRSDLKDLRQSAVALGVSQKDGSNQIVQDWLDTGSGDNSSDSEQEAGEEGSA